MSFNCSIPCLKLVDLSSACPTREISIKNPKDWFEIFLILLSMSPYPFVFILCLLTLFKRTTRIAFVVIMLFFDFFFINVVKNIIKEPRPNYECNHEYGNPSNHTCVYTSIIFWFVMEKIFLKKIYQFKNNKLLLFFIALYPFVLYSRFDLNYHYMSQIASGFLLGMVIGVTYFLLCTKVILRIKFIAIIYKFFFFWNNMSEDFVDTKKNK